MKHIFILLFILAGVTTTFAQTDKPAPVITRYYCFTGNIDKYPVTFHLYRINDKFSGSYYYNSSEEAIDVYGEIDKTHFLRLTHADNEGTEQEVLSGIFKDPGFSGTWISKGKLLPFRIAKKKDNSGLTFDYIYTRGEKKLPKKDDNYRSELSYDAATIWPTAIATHPAVNLVKKIIYDEFNEKDGKEDIGKVMLREKNGVLNPGKDEEVQTYSLEKRVQVEYLNNQLLTLSKFTYFDMGGAHGNYGTKYICIDLAHSRELNIADVLDTLTCTSQLQTLLEKKFRVAYKVKKEEKISDYLLTDVITVTDNFSLTSKGIWFNYDPYEIGSYAMGEIRLFIPYKELSGCLKPEFKELIGL